MTKSMNRTRSRCFIIFLIAALFITLPQTVIPQQPEKCVTPSPTIDEKFKQGQVWRVKGRAWEQDATATILRVESIPKIGTVIHLRIDHVAMHTCPGNPVWDSIQHTPMAREAFDRSVTDLIRSDPNVPDHNDGYDEWRLHCGGVYTITVAEVLGLNEKNARTNWHCD